LSKLVFQPLVLPIVTLTHVPDQPVLMVSSYLPELLGVCDRIAVMCRGVLGPARETGSVDEHSIMLEATGAASNAGDRAA